MVLAEAHSQSQVIGRCHYSIDAIFPSPLWQSQVILLTCHPPTNNNILSLIINHGWILWKILQINCNCPICLCLYISECKVDEFQRNQFVSTVIKAQSRTCMRLQTHKFQLFMRSKVIKIPNHLLAQFSLLMFWFNNVINNRFNFSAFNAFIKWLAFPKLFS